MKYEIHIVEIVHIIVRGTQLPVLLLSTTPLLLLAAAAGAAPTRPAVVGGKETLPHVDDPLVHILACECVLSCIKDLILV